MSVQGPDIARIVREAREARGLTRAEVGRRMGLTGKKDTGKAISRVEHGEHSPSVDKLSRIAAGLGAELIIEFR